MADYTKIYGIDQIESGSIDRDKLKNNFLEGSDIDFTGGSNDATIIGLKDATNVTSPATLGQLNAAVASLEASVNGFLEFKGLLDASSPAAFEAAEHSLGDFYKISVSGTIASVAVSAGDNLYITADVAVGALTSADFEIIDNTESPDILRESDIVDSLISTSTTQPLSANQGKVLKDLYDALAAQVKVREYDVVLTHTVGSAALTIPHTPVVGTVRLYKRGMRMTETYDYTISGAAITLNTAARTNDIYTVDYER